MPIGPYASFDECVAKNSDKASPEGFCAYLEHQITGQWPGAHSDMPDEAWETYRSAYSDFLNGTTKPLTEVEAEAHEHAVGELKVKGWTQSRIGWVKEYAAPKFRTAVGVRIFAVGTWTDSAGVSRDWTEEDLDNLVKAFNSGVPGNVPLKAGHTPDTFNLKIAEKLGVPVELVTGDHGSGQIAIGRMATLERRGNLLMASFERVPEQIADLIESGLFSTVSVEIEDGLSGFSSVITAVALLGAEEPAVDEATLDRALVFGGKREKARVLTFGKETEYLDREFTTLQDKMSEVIKGMRGAPVFRALISQLRTLFNQITRKRSEHQSLEDIPPYVQAYADQHFQGNVNALIRWAGGVGFDACVAELTGKEGIADPERLCGWLKSRSGAHQKSNEEDNVEKLSIKEMKAKFQEPPPGEETPPADAEVQGEAIEALMVIAQALGLGEEATVEDILAAIEALKEGSAPAEGEMAKFQKATDDLKKANDRISKLEHNERVHDYLEQTRLFTAIPGKKSEEIAVELAEIEETRGKDKADSMLSTYQELNRMGVAATKALGTSVPGSNEGDYEKAVSEYMKEHPEAKKGEAHKAVMTAHPELRYEKDEK